MATNRHRKHVLRVLRLVRIVERCEKTKTVIEPEMLCSALPHLTDVDDRRWKKEFLALKKVA